MYKVCIVGRVNVGKSSLFNRLVKYKKALVSNIPHLTRDRNYGFCEWKNKTFCLIDTGGVEKEDGSFEKNWIVKNVGLGIEESDMILIVVDGKEGINPIDKDILRWIRTKSKNKKIVLAINKIDLKEREKLVADFYELGVGTILKTSALHNLGIIDLLDEIIKDIPEVKLEKMDIQSDIKISIVGKPNVGKSTLFNTIFGETKVLVSDVPGTTRDAIDSIIKKNNRKYTIIDTAGIKKGPKRLEFDIISVRATEEAIKRSDVVLLLLDAKTFVNHQDLRIAGLIKEYNKACIILVNKWDVIEDREDYVKKFLNERKKSFPFLLFAPAMFVSAKENLRVEKIFETIERVYKEYTKRVPDIEVSELFRDCYAKKYPPRGKHKHPVVILGGKQVNTSPPVFYVKLSRNGEIPMAYSRYLENNLRDKYRFEGSPVKIVWALDDSD